MDALQTSRWEVIRDLDARLNNRRFYELRKAGVWVETQDDAIQQLKLLLECAPKNLNGTLLPMDFLLPLSEPTLEHEQIDGKTFVQKLARQGQNHRLKQMATCLNEANQKIVARSGSRDFAEAYEKDIAAGIDLRGNPNIAVLGERACATLDAENLSDWLRERHGAYIGMHQNKVAGDTQTIFMNEIQTRVEEFCAKHPEFKTQNLDSLMAHPTREGTLNVAEQLQGVAQRFRQQFHSDLQKAIVADLKVSKPEPPAGEITEFIYELEWAHYASKVAARMKALTHSGRT